MAPRIGGDAIRLDGYHTAWSSPARAAFPARRPPSPSPRGRVVLCHWCGVCPLWGPAAPDRHAARSRSDPEAPRAPGDGPLRPEPRPRPARVSRCRALIRSSRGAAAAVVPRPRGIIPAEPGGSFAAWRRRCARL